MPAIAVVGAFAVWAGSAAAAAATAVGAGAIAASVGVVTAAVAKGVVIGAVLGAVSSAITGGDILEGALRGAAIGGITAGVFSAGGIATGLWTAEAQMAGMGLDAAGQPLATSGADVGASAGIGQAGPPAEMSSIPGEQIAPPPDMTPVAGGGSVQTPPPPPAKTPMSPESSRIYAGIGQGLSQGLAEVGAAKIEADKERDLLEWQAKEADRVRDLNQPGTFQPYAAKITPATWWNKYTQKVTPNYKKGLLA